MQNHKDCTSFNEFIAWTSCIQDVVWEIKVLRTRKKKELHIYIHKLESLWQVRTIIIFPNNAAQEHIILAMERGVNLREEELGAVGISRMMILWLSCEVVMDAAPSKLPKLTDHSYLHQLKLGVVCSVVFTQGYLGVVARGLLPKRDSLLTECIPYLRRFPLPR